MTRRAALIALFALIAVASSTSSYAAETYQYDPVGRLSDVSYPNGGSIHVTYDANGNILSIVTSLAVTAVEGPAPAFAFALGPAAPNPGSGPRDIVFSTPSRGHVTLRVFDVSGRLVAVIVDAELGPGPHSLRFFTDRWGSGVYYYRLEMAGRVRSGRMVVLK